MCDVGVAFLHDVITPGKITVEFAARAGCARNHEPAVPVVGEANQDTRLTLRVLGDASVDLNARYRPGDGRAMGRIGGNHECPVRRFREGPVQMKRREFITLIRVILFIGC